MQNQAASIVDKDTQIARLEQRVRALEAAEATIPTPAHPTDDADDDDADTLEGASCESYVSQSVTVPLSMVGPSAALGDAAAAAPLRLSSRVSSGRGRSLAHAISADRAAMQDWETLPVPNTFKEALEQILMLQVCAACCVKGSVQLHGLWEVESAHAHRGGLCCACCAESRRIQGCVVGGRQACFGVRRRTHA